MKRWIHSATNSKKITGKEAAQMVKDFLESLGFQRVGQVEPKRKSGMSGGQTWIRFSYHPENRPDTKYDMNRADFNNYRLAQELYGPAEEIDDFDPLTHKGSRLKQVYDGILEDVDHMFKENGIDYVVIDSYSSGLSGLSSAMQIYTYVPKS